MEKLHRNGWTPKRTIVIAGWDAEEIGELGSAAYVAAHRVDLQNGCIAYLNTDESAAGPDFGASAAAAIADGVVGPIQSVLGIGHPDIDPPSGGSDFESFIYTMGTPIVDMGYTGALGTYHSPYDDFRFASLYADPGFVHHEKIAQTLGVVAMRLAQSDRPFAFAPYATALDSGAREMIRKPDTPISSCPQRNLRTPSVASKRPAGASTRAKAQRTFPSHSKPRSISI